MNNAIGIISYLPDDKVKRSIRKRTLRQLIAKCGEIFNLPVILIAQNYTPVEISIFKNYDCIVYTYEKLGILKARYELQQIFIKSHYDNLIMLDDDCVIEATPLDGLVYLKQLNNYVDSYGVYQGNLLKLFSISKTLYSKFQWPLDKKVEKGDLFEDAYLTMWLEKNYPNNGFRYNTNIKELSNSQNDINSTWLDHVSDKDRMFKNTYTLVYQKKTC